MKFWITAQKSYITVDDFDIFGAGQAVIAAINHSDFNIG
jgi:hypothetical protein